MLYIFTALYCEARMLIEQYHLTKRLGSTRFQVYDNETYGVLLTITGVGEIAAAAAVGSVCTARPPEASDFLINIGTCACAEQAEGMFVCSRITEQATGRTFYPDILYRHGLKEAGVVTGMQPWNQGQDEGKAVCAADGALYDMEAAAVYQSGAYFFGPHQMIFLKIVSDSGTASAVRREQVEHLMEQYAKPLSALIGRLQKISERAAQRNARPQLEIALIEKLCMDLHCSKTMRDSLQGQLHYLTLIGADYIPVIQDLYREGLLPCRDKRAGKLCLKELRQRLFTAARVNEDIPADALEVPDDRDDFQPSFSRIYVETAVLKYPRTQRILSRFPSAEIIEIRHYKDVFCRSRQSVPRQHRSQQLILAAKSGSLLYRGAPVCQSFGNQYFYYTSCAMNCVSDCEYCYLKGMYPSANIVIFVNLEDIFEEVRRLLQAHPLYLCVSYDTDLLALEQVCGYVKEWCDFAGKHENLTIEIRTKYANQHLFENVRPLSNMIYAFTLSPQAVIDAFEHQTPSLAARLSCAAALVQAGCPVRLCFDPMIYLPGWERHYEQMLTQVCDVIDMDKIMDVSVGTFRISQDYLKNMRKQEKDSAIVWFPFQCENGCCHYPDALLDEMEGFLTGRLAQLIPEEKIFRWRAETERANHDG